MAEGETTTFTALTEKFNLPLGNYKKPKLLYCSNGGHFLRILPDGTVDGTRDRSDQHIQLQLSAQSIGEVYIKSTETGQFLAMDTDGLLYGSGTDAQQRPPHKLTWGEEPVQEEQQQMIGLWTLAFPQISSVFLSKTRSHSLLWVWYQWVSTFLLTSTLESLAKAFCVLFIDILASWLVQLRQSQSPSWPFKVPPFRPTACNAHFQTTRPTGCSKHGSPYHEIVIHLFQQTPEHKILSQEGKDQSNTLQM
ncbi:FGF1 [Cervus elaphus hippelaphus]|uniref:Fibroblast growth factor n=1 Tax=Cervus elaphus hippelaphus TaxID=46360 RepID=A0A212D097_CEREH|nr:FGF1 [Cervus elaphus hippelaphus]